MIKDEQLAKVKKILTDLKATEKNCGACGQFFNSQQADAEGFHLAIFCDAADLVIVNKKMATVTEVLEETQKMAPAGWIVSYEYPDQIGVTHPTLTDDQFISFGDINYDFGFNDVFASDVCGSMEGLTDAKEIAESFWRQIAAIYPNLIKGE
jgi:hypothetical protein